MNVKPVNCKSAPIKSLSVSFIENRDSYRHEYCMSYRGLELWRRDKETYGSLGGISLKTFRVTSVLMTSDLLAEP